MPQIPQNARNAYQSPPGSGSNDGALPAVYDPSWQGYTNLTAQQVVAFQSFPQDLAKYLAQRRWLAEISGTTVGGIPLKTQYADQQKIAGLMQAVDKGILTSTEFFDANGNVQTVNAAAINAIYSAVVQFVDSTYLAAAALANGISAVPPTVTTRKQIDTAIGAVAPNSPSALNPSAT